MKNDFHRMEDEMGKLDSTLSTVMDFSDKVSSALQEKREQIAKLSGVHILLQKVEILESTFRQDRLLLQKYGDNWNKIAALETSPLSYKIVIEIIKILCVHAFYQ